MDLDVSLLLMLCEWWSWWCAWCHYRSRAVLDWKTFLIFFVLVATKGEGRQGNKV
jgi:hypothetical protein